MDPLERLVSARLAIDQIDELGIGMTAARLLVVQYVIAPAKKELGLEIIQDQRVDQMRQGLREKAVACGLPEAVGDQWLDLQHSISVDLQSAIQNKSY